MDDFETITGKVNNADKPYPPPSREGSVLGNWKENGNDNSPSPKHPGKKLNIYSAWFKNQSESHVAWDSILSCAIHFIAI